MPLKTAPGATLPDHRPRQPNRREFCRTVAAGAGSIAAASVGGCGFSLPILQEPNLETPWTQRHERYDVLVIGSGYGGAITAARLSAQPDRTVAVLERGQQWPVGSFPDTPAAAASALRLPGINPSGLFELCGSRDMTVLQGCGLGGTSLINGNVAIAPDADVFDDPRWPAELTLETLQPYYDAARQMLGVAPHPNARQFTKYQTLQQRARAAGRNAEPVPIAVNFAARGPNAQGVMQSACIDCGDCMTGCNVGAKNTVAMNYLPLAASNGADIFTNVEIQYLQRGGSLGWRAEGVRHLPFGQTEPVDIEAATIVLAAGSLGSTGILLRSRERGLSSSPRLGDGFNGNGDFIAIAYNGDEPQDTLGFGNRSNSPLRPNAPGPAVIGAVRYDPTGAANQRFLVEDLAFPSAMLASLLQLAPLAPGEDTDTGDEAAEFGRALLGRPSRPFDSNNALAHSLPLIVMGRDTIRGRIILSEDNAATVDWPSENNRVPSVEIINAELREYAALLGAIYLSNPLWQLSDRRSLVTAHPLGGCPMGESIETGACNANGQMFDDEGALIDGLFVADGSIIPTALGANPLLTISALAERIATKIWPGIR